MPSISFVIPSINRESLHRTIASIEMQPGDEICVEFDIPRSNRWGNEQRNKAIARAKGDYLAFIDDDDEFIKGHRQIMADAIEKNPEQPILFKMQYPNGDTLWKTKEVIPGNVSTPMILIPNKKAMIFDWQPKRNMSDFIFINTWKWSDIIWREEIIAIIGNNDGKAIHHE